MTTTATPTDALVETLLKIERLIATNQLREAAQALNAARASAPNDPRVFLLASRMAEAGGNAQGALDAAQAAMKLAPNWVVAVAELAYLLARQNHMPQAFELARRAVSMAPQDPEVLGRMIEVAHRTQQFPQALVWLQSAVALAPDNVELQRLFARDLAIVGKLPEALALYRALAEAHPADVESITGGLRAALALGDRDSALKFADTLLALDPASEEAAFWHTMARGETPATLPAALVRAQFEPMADLYDLHMVKGLRYTLPYEMAAMIVERYPTRQLNVLDLGCGTGLLGLHLGRIEGALIGVDLTVKMVDLAARHKVYDRFHTVNLLDALRETPEAQYDVISAADVFPYVGALDQAIPNAFRVLKAGGYLMFSIEATQAGQPALVLQPSLLYAHDSAAVQAQCQAAGFDDVLVKPVVLRQENQKPVNGFVVVAHKPA